MAPLQRSKSAIQVTDQSQIQHFTHQHILLKLYMAFEFKCDGCNMGGYGVRYTCSACEFDLHEQCATSPHRISFHLHPHHQLVLINRPGDSHFCYVCRGFTNGLSYTCECPTCEFDVHPLCIKTPVSTGVPSVTMDSGQQTEGVHQSMQGMSTTSFGGFCDVHTTHPVIIHQYQQQQQGIRTTSTFDGNNGPSNNQRMMINQQQQQKQGMHVRSFGGYDGVNNSQPMMVNHRHHQQPHQQQQVIPMTGFGGFHGTNSNQHVMMNHHLQQTKHQGIPVTAFNGYQGVNTNQMINHQQQQQQGMPTSYNIVNNNQTVMINHPQQQQQPAGSSNNTKMGIAADILSTTLIGVPISPIINQLL